MKNIPFLKRFAFCLPVLICSTFLYADDPIKIPKSLNIQGMVTNDTGKPVTKKNASLEVKIGDDSSVVHITDNVDIDNGIYNKIIDISSALEVLKLSDKTPLSVTIKDINGSNITSAGELSSTPYSIYSSTSNYAFMLDPSGTKLVDENFDFSHEYKIKVSSAQYISNTTGGLAKDRVWGILDDTNTQGWVDIAKAVAPEEAINAHFVSTATVTENKDSNNSQKLWAYYGTDARNQAWISTGAITVGKADKITNDPSGTGGTDTDKIWSYKSGSGQDWHFIVPANFGAVNYNDQYKIKVDSAVWAEQLAVDWHLADSNFDNTKVYKATTAWSTDAVQAGKITSDGSKVNQVWGITDNNKNQGWIDVATAVTPKESENAMTVSSASAKTTEPNADKIWIYDHSYNTNNGQKWIKTSEIKVGTASYLTTENKLVDGNFTESNAATQHIYNITVGTAAWAKALDKDFKLADSNLYEGVHYNILVTSAIAINGNTPTDDQPYLWGAKTDKTQGWFSFNGIKVASSTYADKISNNPAVSNTMLWGYNGTNQGWLGNTEINVKVSSAQYISNTTDASKDKVWGITDNNKNQGWIDVGQVVTPEHAKKLIEPEDSLKNNNLMWLYNGTDSSKPQKWTEISKVEIGTATVAKKLLTSDNGGERLVDKNFTTVAEDSEHKYNIRVGTAAWAEALKEDFKLGNNNLYENEHYNILVTSATQMNSTPENTSKPSVWIYKTDKSQNWEYLDTIQVATATYLSITGTKLADGNFQSATAHTYSIAVGTAAYLSTSGAKLVDGNFDTISDNPSNPVIYDIKVASSVITERYEIYQSTQVVVEFDAANSVASSSVGKVAVINSSGKVEVCSTNADTKIIGIISEVDSNKVKVVISGVVEGISCSSTGFAIGGLLQATDSGEVKVNSSAQIGTVIGKAISTRNDSGKIKVLVNLQ